jgi:hypothetical protein
LKDFNPTPLTLLGILFSTLGAILFSAKTIKDNIKSVGNTEKEEVKKEKIK